MTGRSSIHWFNPQTAAGPELSQSPNQEPDASSGSPTCVQGPKGSVHPLLLSQGTRRELDWNWRSQNWCPEGMLANGGKKISQFSHSAGPIPWVLSKHCWQGKTFFPSYKMLSDFLISYSQKLGFFCLFVCSVIYLPFMAGWCCTHRFMNLMTSRVDTWCGG